MEVRKSLVGCFVPACHGELGAIPPRFCTGARPHGVARRSKSKAYLGVKAGPWRGHYVGTHGHYIWIFLHSCMLLLGACLAWCLPGPERTRSFRKLEDPERTLGTRHPGTSGPQGKHKVSHRGPHSSAVPIIVNLIPKDRARKSFEQIAPGVPGPVT